MEENTRRSLLLDVWVTMTAQHQGRQWSILRVFVHPCLQIKFLSFVNLFFWRETSPTWGHIYVKETRFLIILHIFFPFCHLSVNEVFVFFGPSKSVLCLPANASWCWIVPINHSAHFSCIIGSSVILSIYGHCRRESCFLSQQNLTGPVFVFFFLALWDGSQCVRSQVHHIRLSYLYL